MPHTFASLEAVQSTLGEDEALLSFQVGLWESYAGEAEGGSWVTVATRHTRTVHRLPDRSRLAPAVPIFNGLLESGQPAGTAAAVSLYGALMADTVAALPPGITRIVIVPDGVLHQLSFEALRASPDAPPLGARYEIALTPSATLWLQWRAAPRRTPAGKMLVAADPVLEGMGESAPRGSMPRDRRSSSVERGAGADPSPWRSATPLRGVRLGRLPHARNESRAIAHHVAGADVLIGARAFERAMKTRDLREYDVLHFAAHALADEAHPERSAVLLAPGGIVEDGLLQAREIAALDIEGTIVVLSACQTAAGAVLSGEGVLSLARAFFEGGAHAVIGTRWPLRDADAAMLFDTFYRRLAEGVSLSAALKATRDEARAAGRSPSVWAGLVLLGNGDLRPFAGRRPGPARPNPHAHLAPVAVSLTILVALGSSSRAGAPRQERSATARQAFDTETTDRRDVRRCLPHRVWELSGGNMTRGIGAIVVAAVVTSPVGVVFAQNTASRVLVLDQQARTVTALEFPSGQAAQTTSLQGTPSDLLVTGDGKRLLVLDRGQGRDAGENGFQAKTRAAVTILDGSTLAVQDRVELGWGLEPVAMLSSAGDRLSVVGPGYQGRTPAETLAREVVTVDLASAKVLSRIELPRRASAFLATPDGRTAVVLSAREEPRKAQVLPAELRFLDLTTGSVVATVALEGDPARPVLAPDSQFLYLLDPGKPSNNPDKNVNGRLHIVSMATRAVQSVADAGSKPRGLVLDDSAQQLLMLSDGQPVKGPANTNRPGELRVIRGGAPSAPIPVGTSPERLELSADGKTLHVLGPNSAAKVTLPDLKPTAPLTFKVWGEELRVSPDGARLYMVNGEYFKTFDLATGAQLTEVRTGRMSMKLLQALETGLTAETKRLEAENAARRQGRSYYAYADYTLAQPRGTMAIRPDGKAVYALNSQTEDLTVIDGVSGAILQKVPASGFSVLFMPAASVALVPSADALHAVDLATHQKKADIVTRSTGNFDQSELSPDGRLAVVHGSGGVLLVDATSGTPVATFKAFGQVADVAIDWGGKR